MMLGGAANSIALPFDQCIVPDGVSGPVAIWITSDQQPLVNNVRDRATSQLVAGPLIAIIDTQPDMIAQLARTGSSSSSSSGDSTSTQTITPEQASSIIAGASATASAATAGSTDPAASPVGNASSGASVSTTPNLTTGPSPDGHITVDGWKGLPN